MNLLEELIQARNGAESEEARFSAMADVLAAHPDADLATLINEASANGDALFALGDDMSDDDVETIEALADVRQAAERRTDELATLRAARTKRAAEALERAKAKRAAAAEGGDGGDGGEGEEGDGGEEGGEGDGRRRRSSNAVVRDRRAQLGQIRSYNPGNRNEAQRARPNEGFWTIESSTGVDLGDLSGLAAAVQRRIGGLERAGVGRTVEASIAMIRRTLPEEYFAQDGGKEETVTLAQLDSIRDERAAALVAAGGWCAPSEIIYTLCPTASMEGLLDHPTVIVRRGGLRWPQTPDFSTVYGNVGFNQSESQAAAGTTKTCYDITCPGFSEQRMNAIGLCLRSGILTAQAYPELVEYYVEQSLVAHAHQVNAFKLAQMQSLATTVHFQPVSGTPNTIGYGPGAFASILGSLEIQVEDLRAKYRWGLNEVLECVAPTWAEPLIRSDLSKRTGVDLANVTDEMIAEYFANRSMNLTLVRDWQDAATTSGGAGFGGTTPMLAYPATVGFLLYHPDTYIIGQADVIDLSAIYDSTNVQTNTFTRLFSEEGVLVGRRCFEPRFVQVDTCPTGLTGGWIAPATSLPVLTCPAA